jgi:penicillin amidase
VRRVFKYTNGLVLILLLAGLGFFYRYAWRALPEDSGDVALDVTQAAMVERDAYGVAHIRAKSIADAIYLQGYTHAQERFWQMEAARRFASGELAEIVGRDAVNNDLEARKLRLRRIAQAMLGQLPAEDRKWLAAYARGVNDWLAAHRDRLPLEIQALGYQPRLWTIVDSLVVYLQLYRQLSTSWPTEAEQGVMLERGADPKKVRELFPTRNGFEISMGSNAWALAGKRSTTGKPILAGDPHLQFNWPSTFYLVHLAAEDLNCIGASIPGGPGIVIGHNQAIAWSMTTLHFDVQDLYFNDAVVALERETIRVKGAGDVEFVHQIGSHGPVVEHQGKSFALKWSVNEGKDEYPFLRINRAKNWTEFRDALRRMGGPSHNYIYADRDGNVGYQAAGHMPIRKHDHSDVPLDARDAANEWQGYIPFDELPSVLNPASGAVVNANQNPFPLGYKYPVNGHFTPPYRQRQASARLAAKQQWRPDEMTGIQMDVYSAFHHFLAGQLTAAMKGRNVAREDVREALEQLGGWNGQMEVGLASPMIVSLAYQNVRTAVLQRAGVKTGDYSSLFAPSIVERLLRERPKDWFRDYDQMLAQALVDAVDAGAKLQGKNPRFWDYGRFHQLRIENPVLGPAVNVGRFLVRPWMPLQSWVAGLRIPLVEGYVQAGPIPLAGATQTVKQASPRNGAALRFTADLASWDNSTMTITLGQSGHAFAKHSKDYWGPYSTGGAVPLPFENAKADATLRVRPLNSK